MDAGPSQDPPDASSLPDAQLPAAGYSAGVGGSASSSGGHGGNSQQHADAGGLDASVGVDAAIDVDAAMPAAGSGGAVAAGSGGVGAGGSGGSAGVLPFDNCMQGSGVLFCNGFEEALPWTPTPWGYERITSGSTEERSTTKKYAGAASAHMSTTENSRATASRVAYSSLGERKSGDIWLRYYYYLPRTVAIDTYFSAGVMSELEQPYTGFSLLIYSNMVEVESSLLPSRTTSSYTFPRDQWVCVEHHVFADANSGMFEIYMDGLRALKATSLNTLPTTGWSSAEVGIHYVGEGQGPVDVYVDNVVVSTARYGCD